MKKYYVKTRYKAKVQISKVIEVTFTLPSSADEETILKEAEKLVMEKCRWDWGDGGEEFDPWCMSYEEME